MTTYRLFRRRAVRISTGTVSVACAGSAQAGPARRSGMDDQSTSRSNQGQFTYYEGEQPQGYTNAGRFWRLDGARGQGWPGLGDVASERQ
jgi:hypothetical protein